VGVTQRVARVRLRQPRATAEMDKHVIKDDVTKEKLRFDESSTSFNYLG